MKNPVLSDTEAKFEALQKIEKILEKKVDGYLSMTAQFKGYDDYKTGHNGEFSVTEKIRVADSIKMFKSIKSFEQEFGVTPKIKAFSSIDWQKQLKGEALLAKNDIQMELYGEMDNGQIMIHNNVSNTHSIIDFKFAFDKDGETGHIQLSPEDKKTYPKLESALRQQLLANGSSTTSPKGLKDHMSVDTQWMMSKIVDTKDAKGIVLEIADATGPKVMINNIPQRHIENSSSISMSMY